MNKEELKKAFDKEFEKISVSDELKSKTLKSIENTPTMKASRLPYIRNFAAIFVVTLLCVSIYFVNNKPQNNVITSDTLQEEKASTPETIQNDYNRNFSTLQKSSPIQTLPDSSQKSENSKEFFIPETSSKSNSSIYNATPNLFLQATGASNDMGLQDSDLKKENIEEETTLPITEDEFLKKHPDAKKIENGYIIYEDGKENLYIFKNNTLENIIIID